jgi:tRNA-2-methylthio-N6-dimethylallyladenosine synthase
MHYFIKTLGCAMNISDSQRLASFLESKGFSESAKIDTADLVIFNTCGIRQAAENRVYSFINNLRKINKKTKIIVTGCISHRNDVQKRLKSKVDLFTEIKDFPNSVSSILYQVSCMNSKTQNTKHKTPTLNAPHSDAGGQNTKNIFNKENIDYLSINPKQNNNFQALIPIMTGCNNFCSYCVVPYARGREISRPADEIIKEIKSLLKNGYTMITLLGQNVNSYESKVYQAKKSTKKEDKTTDFAKLLLMINKIPGNFWITFVSSHPKDMSDELIETATKCKKICEWVHLPVQAGDDEILRRMNRKYTQKHYLERIRKIKSSFKKYKPGTPFSISSDIIVGFPGETKKQFQQSEIIMQKAKFDMVYFGQFSPRPGTAAWKMKDNVSSEEKTSRENVLNEILKKTAHSNNKKYIGHEMEVLIEKEKKGEYFGKTRTMKNIKISSKKNNLIGKIVKVRITKAGIWNLEGILT